VLSEISIITVVTDDGHHSSRPLVLVDQAAEWVTPLHGPGGTRGRRGAFIRLHGADRRACRCGHLLADSLMTTMTVVVADVASKDTFEVALIDDQKVIETLGTDGSHEPLGVGVVIGGSDEGS
jgi:hypothetical protein